MDVKKIAVPLAVIGGLGLAFRLYGWPGIAAAAGALVFWMLLYVTRLMQVLKRAANRPVGYVDSAVMLNAKLRPGMPLMHVLAMTRSLGVRLSDKDAQPEQYRWQDAGASSVSCTFVAGKLTQHTLQRPPAAPSD